jgi:O-antigen/teichoic acid export membrane protein
MTSVNRPENGALGIPPHALTSGSLLARNVGMNLIGWGLPAIAALVALPILVRALGDARFGALTLVWTAIGYFSLFDLGIARALTHAVADRFGRQQEHEIGAITWTALGVIIPLGVAGGVVLYVVSPFLANTLLRVPGELRVETATAFRVLAVAIPFTVATAALRGVLEASQRFGVVNALRIPYGLLTFLGPLATIPFSRSLVPAVAVLAGGRMLLFVAHLIACVRVAPGLKVVRWSRAQIAPLVHFGGWMTVSNVVHPFMNTLDRFVVGAVIGVSLVTYYATPHELVTKMWLFTAALLPVFFPAFTTSVASDPLRAASLFDRVLRTTFAALFLPTLAMVVLAREILGIWLGPAFATQSGGVMQILAVAIFVNTLGQCALTLIQALGRPDLTGKYHMAELPVYALLLWWLLPRYGIVGVAVAWAIRAIGDSILLLLTCPVLLPQARRAVQRIFVWLGIAVPTLIALALIPSSTARLSIFAIAAPAWLGVCWWWILTPVERSAPMRALSIAFVRD